MFKKNRAIIYNPYFSYASLEQGRGGWDGQKGSVFIQKWKAFILRYPVILEALKTTHVK